MNIDRVNLPQTTALPSAPRGKEEDTPQQGAAPPQDSVSLKADTAPPKKELTVLFYMHGQYKDLHKTTASTLFNIEEAGSDENVNVVAQLGRAPQDVPGQEPHHIDGDWSGVKRFYVTKHDHSDMNMSLEQWLDVEKQIPDNALVHYTLSEIYSGMGDKTKALEEYNKSKELGMVKYMENYDAPESKKIREELDAITKPFDDAAKDKQIFGSQVVETLPDGTKMGDPKSLSDFIAWGMKNYPAEHYVVVVTGHGGAWIGALEQSPQVMNKAVKDGVAAASKETGEQKKIDAFVFNSCYMGNMEAAYEMRDIADINISSENYSRGNMLHDWNDHISRVEQSIKDSGTFDPKAFAKDFVEYYRAEGKDVKENFPEFIRWKESYLTLTALDTQKMGGVVDEWKNFIKTCNDQKVPDHIIFREFDKSQGYNSSAFNPAGTIFAYYDMIKDIGDIMKNVQENPAIPQAVKDQAAKVQAAVKEAVIAEQHEGKDMDNSTGITAWTPTNAVDIAFMAQRYEKENVPEFAARSEYLPWLKDAAKKVDKKVLSDFMADNTLIRNLNQILGNPKIELTDAEKKTMGEAKDIVLKHAFSLKEKLTLTEPRMAVLWKGLESGEIDYNLYSALGKHLTENLQEQDGLKDS
ncbi:MAG: clostripain-related cysteine peptidase [Candidatus Xenobiia bacterium LiM19]